MSYAGILRRSLSLLAGSVLDSSSVALEEVLLNPKMTLILSGSARCVIVRKPIGLSIPISEKENVTRIIYTSRVRSSDFANY